MALKTPLEMAQMYQDAIVRVLDGQEVWIGQKRHRMADLDALQRGYDHWRAVHAGSQGQGLAWVTGLIKRD